MPEDSDPSELIVGLLDSERVCGERWPAADFNAKVRDPPPTRHTKPRRVERGDLNQIRSEPARLFQTRRTLPAGRAMELEFVQPNGAKEANRRGTV